jgi:hypothetical protein
MRGLLCAVALLAHVSTLSAQELTANDTSAILAAVLSHYRTVNGPIVQMARTIACGDPRYTGPARLAQGRPCSSAGVDTVLARYAEANSVELVAVGTELPRCRWSQEDEAAARRGLRLDLMAPDIADGRVRASIMVRCGAIVRDSERGFVHSVQYEMRQEDGAWRVVRVLSSLIT